MNRVFPLILLISTMMFIHTSTALQNSDKLNFIFVLHANQALVPYGEVANDLNYYPVLQTLRAHPSINVILHISGTLISVLQMFSPETLQLIQDGIDDGQFEILGSAYSQNVMYSQYTPGSTNTDAGDFDNNLQIKLHKNILEDHFGVAPTTFWNPERVWDPVLIQPLITDGGYNATFIEDHIIQQVSNGDEHLVRTTGSASNPLYIFSDDRDLIWNETSQTIGPINKLARGPQGFDNDFTNTTIDEIIHYLQTVYQRDVNDELTVVYAEDMEAWGLWQEEGRSDGGGSWKDDVENVVARLDALLTRFEEENKWLQLSHPKQVLNELNGRSYSYEHIDTIPFGEAMWMNHAARDAGYASWKEWQDGFGNDYRQSFTKARNDLKEAQIVIQNATDASRIEFASDVLEYMEFIYAANQFEFGCWGCNFGWWHRVATVGIGKAVIDWIFSDQGVESLSADLDHDSFLEYILRDNDAMYVFARQGGRLIGWFDKKLGETLIYNDAPASYLTSGSTNHQEYIPDLSSFWGRSTKKFALRQKALIDLPRYNFTSNYPSSIYAYSRTSDTLTLSKDGSDAKVEKVFSILNGSLKSKYIVTNKRDDEMPFSVASFYNPGNLDMLKHGMSNIEYVTDGTGIELGVRNTERDISVVLEGSRIKGTVHRNPGMFAVGLEFKFDPVPGNGVSTYSFTLLAKEANYTPSLDRIPPTITVISPPNLTEFSGLLEIDVDVSDESKLDHVDLIFGTKVVDSRVDSGILQFYDSSLTNGTYTFLIVAYDVAGNKATAQLSLTYIGEKIMETTNTQSSPFPLSLIALFFARKRSK